MMSNLIRYSLDNEKTHEYVKDKLQDVNIVSTIVLDYIERVDGEYFTLLPINSNIERLYEFQSGIMLPQNPIIEYEVDGQRATFSLIPSIKEELSELICKFLVNNKKYICLIDDVTRKLNDPNSESLNLSKVVVSINDEMYYLLTGKESRKDVIIECLRKSESFWHSLVIISLIEKQMFLGNVLNLSQLHNICKNIDLVFIGAYDAEGYVFWTKSETNIINLISER